MLDIASPPERIASDSAEGEVQPNAASGHTMEDAVEDPPWLPPANKHAGSRRRRECRCHHGGSRVVVHAARAWLELRVRVRVRVRVGVSGGCTVAYHTANMARAEFCTAPPSQIC